MEEPFRRLREADTPPKKNPGQHQAGRGETPAGKAAAGREDAGQNAGGATAAGHAAPNLIPRSDAHGSGPIGGDVAAHAREFPASVSAGCADCLMVDRNRSGRLSLIAGGMPRLFQFETRWAEMPSRRARALTPPCISMISLSDFMRPIKHHVYETFNTAFSTRCVACSKIRRCTTP